MIVLRTLCAAAVCVAFLPAAQAANLLAEAAANKKVVPGNHSPEFAPVPVPTIRTGVEAMSLILLDELQKK